jgi:hypothetical protein
MKTYLLYIYTLFYIIFCAQYKFILLYIYIWSLTISNLFIHFNLFHKTIYYSLSMSIFTLSNLGLFLKK